MDLTDRETFYQVVNSPQCQVDSHVMDRISSQLTRFSCFSKDEMLANGVEAAEAAMKAIEMKKVSFKDRKSQSDNHAHHGNRHHHRHNNNNNNNNSQRQPHDNVRSMSCNRELDSRLQPLLTANHRHRQDTNMKKTDQAVYHSRINKVADSDFVGILNKLNASNYIRQIDSIMRIVASTQREPSFVTLCIEKCFTQSFYIDLYVKFLFDFLSNIGKHNAFLQKQLVKQIKTFVEDNLHCLNSAKFWEDFKYVEEHSAGDTDLQKKIKIELMGKNITLIKLGIQVYHPWSGEFVSRYANVLKSAGQRSQHINDVSIAELCIEFLIQLSSTVGSRSNYVRLCFESFRTLPVMIEHSRSKLRLMDVADGLGLSLQPHTHQFESSCCTPAYSSVVRSNVPAQTSTASPAPPAPAPAISTADARPSMHNSPPCPVSSFYHQHNSRQPHHRHCKSPEEVKDKEQLLLFDTADANSAKTIPSRRSSKIHGMERRTKKGRQNNPHSPIKWRKGV